MVSRIWFVSVTLVALTAAAYFIGINSDLTDELNAVKAATHSLERTLLPPLFAELVGGECYLRKNHSWEFSESELAEILVNVIKEKGDHVPIGVRVIRGLDYDRFSWMVKVTLSVTELVRCEVKICEAVVVPGETLSEVTDED